MTLLTPEQKQALAAWIAAGDNLSKVQQKLADQFKISVTYMDLRFLVDDLGLELKNAVAVTPANIDLSKTAPARPAPAGGEKKGFFDKLKEKVTGRDDTERIDPSTLDEDDLLSSEGVDSLPPPHPAGPGHVKIELDRVVRPGSVVSGSVTFSDDTSGKWALDQYGRLMLDTGKQGYQPSPADVQAFQRELSAQLQRHGF